MLDPAFCYGITMTQAGASAYSLSNGGTVTNVEMAQVQGTAFGDSFTGLSAGGYFNGRDGADSLTLNWSDARTYSCYVIDSAANSYGYKDYYAGGNYLSATSIETVNLTFGAGDDTLTRYYSTLNPTTRANVNGGAGTDALTLDYSAMTTSISFSLANGGGTVVGQGDTYTNFEIMTFYAGSGNDTLEGGAGNDTFSGGAGFDTLSYENAAAAVSVNLAIAAG